MKIKLFSKKEINDVKSGKVPFMSKTIKVEESWRKHCGRHGDFPKKLFDICPFCGEKLRDKE